MGAVSERVVSLLKDAYGGTEISVVDAVIGENLVLIEITLNNNETRYYGVAHRPPVRFPPTQTLREFDGFTLMEWFGDHPEDVGFDSRAARSVGAATVNALSVPLVEWTVGDPMEMIGSDVSVVATVGLFRPALSKFGARDVRVVEREPIDPASIPAPDTVTVSTYLPGAVDDAFADVDVVFITGSTVVYGGLDSYLAAATAIPTVVVIGATASFLPDPLFAAGVSMIAGARVTAPCTVKSGILAGGCASDLHQHGLEKVFISTDERLPGLSEVSAVDSID